MKASDGLSVTLSTYDYGVAEMLNLTDEEIVAWALKKDELPRDTVVYPDDLPDAIAVFRLIATAAREAAAGGTTVGTVRELQNAMAKMLGPETRFTPVLYSTSAEPRRDAQVTGLYLSWQVVYVEKDAAYLAPAIVERVIEALETLCGRRRKHFAVCKAPASRAPERECGKIFLATRDNAKYCSSACRQRASRAK